MSADAGAALTEAIEVMARLRGPHGCPWDREQTHASLTPYAIEEAHEVAEAAESGDPEALCEELGDLLLQVLFHAQIAQENGTFTLADVASTLVAKLKRRHPHVFAGVRADTAQEVEANWAEIKRRENPSSHPLEGIPTALPALMRAQKTISRARRAGIDPTLPETPGSPVSAASIGAELLAVVAKAETARIDAEQALRSVTRDLHIALDPPPLS